MQSTTRISFQKSLIEIARFLNKSYGLKLTEAIDKPYDPLVRWVDFRLRYIEPQPREVLLAKHLKIYFNGLVKKPWTGQVDRAIHEVLDSFEAGSNVNARQSKTIVKNDINAWDLNKPQLKTRRSDGLWNDWGISHLHLSDEVDSKNPMFYKPSDWQLFCVALPEKLLVLDICKHKKGSEWADKQMVKIMIENWPWHTGRFKMSGIESSFYSWDAEERIELRASGASMSTECNGHTYSPMGLGNTTANVGLKVIRTTSMLREYAQLVADDASHFEGQIMKDLSSVGGKSTSNFGLTLKLNTEGLAVYETEHRRCYRVPSTELYPKSAMGELQHLLTPAWAIDRLILNNEITKGSLYP